jgi:hypothetical protein
VKGAVLHVRGAQPTALHVSKTTTFKNNIVFHSVRRVVLQMMSFEYAILAMQSAATLVAMETHPGRVLLAVTSTTMATVWFHAPKERVQMMFTAAMTPQAVPCVNGWNHYISNSMPTSSIGT